jgi:hypothetical protein
VKPSSTRMLLLVGVVCAAVTRVVLGVIYTDLPPLSWTGVPALLIVAGAEAWTGRDLKARIAGRAGYKPAPPLFVFRMVVLAKATAYTGAVLGGVCIGFVIYLFGLLQAATPRSDMITAGVTFGASMVLLVAALYLENCCRVPKDLDREGDVEPAPPPPPESPFPSH